MMDKRIDCFINMSLIKHRYVLGDSLRAYIFYEHDALSLYIDVLFISVACS